MPETQAQLRTRYWVTLPALVIPLAVSFFYFVLFPGTVIGNSCYGGVKFFLLIWPIVATGLILKEPFRRESPPPGDRLRSVWWGVGFGIAILGLMLVIFQFTPFGEMVRAGTANIREKTEGLGVFDHFLLFALGLSLIHSALEEFYWRWFVYENLRHLISKNWAIVIAAAGFASHHIVILNEFFSLGFALFLGISVGIGGAMWSWIYERHKTLLGPWISHMLIDLGIFGIGYWLLFGG
jgi:membrane protease YdiL (CAAX protease family)